MSSVKFQYFSDIHLEFYNENINKIKRLFKIESSPAHVLLLAGDIGRPNMSTYSFFLNMLSPLYQKIYITSGNHEYYKMRMSMAEVDNMCREVCRNLPQRNVAFLQNEFIALNENIDVYGGTFWSYIPTDKEQYVMSKINDYKYIDNFSPSISNTLHLSATSGLNDYLLHKNNLKKTIVLSHHMPSFHLIDPCYRCMDNDLNYAFASNITCSRYPSIVAWVYGHTHKPYADGRFYCNPIGYPNENKRWTLEMFFDVENCTL